MLLTPWEAGEYMANHVERSIAELFLKLREGDERAALDLFKAYFPRLVAVAKSLGVHQAVYQAEDAAQSAIATFCKRIKRGQLDQANNHDELWTLLALITRRKNWACGSSRNE